MGRGRLGFLLVSLAVLVAGCAEKPGVLQPSTVNSPVTTPCELDQFCEGQELERVVNLSRIVYHHVHAYTGTVSCAVTRPQTSPFGADSDMWRRSCDTDDPLREPWETVVDLADDGLDTDRYGLAIVNVTWTDPDFDGPFDLCEEEDSPRGYSCLYVETNGTAGYHGWMRNVGIKNDAWETFSKYRFWIEFVGPFVPACAQASTCATHPLTVEDFTVSLTVDFVYDVALR